MPVFKRSFDVKALSTWCGNHPGSAVHALLERWALPGERSDGAASLRLAIRGGYLNFYVKGQSVAKLSCGAAGPSVATHSAYVDGRERWAEFGSVEPTQSYVVFGPDQLAQSSTRALVSGWIKTAETYASAEKRFVDDLVAANPGILDLEMGLPATDEPGRERVAPRMDLVVVELASDRQPSIGFWEAKCANNGELRAKGEADPKVRGQLQRYVDWMKSEDRVSEVRNAYLETARMLLDLKKLIGKEGPSIPDSLPYWEKLSQAKEPNIKLQPGVVIGNYWPQGSTERIASERMRQCAKTFEAKGHRAKLENADIQIHQVGPDDMNLVLPPLREPGSAD